MLGFDEPSSEILFLIGWGSTMWVDYDKTMTEDSRQGRTYGVCGFKGTPKTH